MHARPNFHCDSTSPLAYFITFTTYGTWLHGDDRGSVDPANNILNTPYIQDDPQRKGLDRRYRKGQCVTLDARRRSIVHSTVMEVAIHRDWTIHALNVRSNHVHIVISTLENPERVMNTMKSWATRRMVEASVFDTGNKAWTRHGSTRYLWKEIDVHSACQYVCEGQGVNLDSRRV